MPRGVHGNFLRGATNPRFKRGYYITKKGYARYSAGPHRGRYVHRVTAERALGRPLRRDEEVHHNCRTRCCDQDFHLIILDAALHHAKPRRK